MNIAIRHRFGLPLDAWARGNVETADASAAAAVVDAAAASRAMVLVVGPHGSGKTHAVRRALAAAGIAVVEVQRLDRERVHMGDVATALVQGLSDELPRHSAEVRAGQVRRLLGRAEGRPVLLVDDAHLLDHATLRGLKRLRELSWRGRSPLLGIVLVGQSDRTATVPEVGLRTAVARFRGLTVTEAEAALRASCGDAIDADAAPVLAAAPEARNWLELQRLVDRALVEAAARGADRVTAAVAAAVAGKSGEAPVSRRLADDQVDAALERLEAAC